jgi:hypothetical protein
MVGLKTSTYFPGHIYLSSNRYIIHTATGAHPGGGGGKDGCRTTAPQTHQNQNSKNTDFIYMTPKVLRDLPFSRNQPLI